MKVLLFDADGVVLKKMRYFSERFAQEYNIPPEEIVHFFKNEFRLCQQNKADLKEELSKYLPTWKWDKDADDFLDYWFTSDAILDEAVLEEIKKFRSQGFTCYLATDQEKYRAHYLLERLDLKNKLDGGFFSCDLGFQKSQPEFFEQVIEKLGVQPTDILYWDDDPQNVEVAKALGIDARLYTGIEDLGNI
ncbi:HAD-IA family hydrolase [Acetobacteraceae bacterium]|nr:HAD-IA family hydrolase [Candidatus Parcubacteria bacterium]